MNIIPEIKQGLDANIEAGLTALTQFMKGLRVFIIGNQQVIKLHPASDYLIYSSKSINLISDTLGFSDDAAFWRTFKNVSTYTPSEYRQAIQR